MREQNLKDDESRYCFEKKKGKKKRKSGKTLRRKTGRWDGKEPREEKTGKRLLLDSNQRNI